MQKLITLSLIIVALGGCAISRHGTKEYTNINTINILDSWEDSQLSTRIVNAGEAYESIDAQEITQILDLRKSALEKAISIPDYYLDEVHPDLKQHFRNEYQKSLQLFIEAHDEGDNSKSIDSGVLSDRWADWYDKNRDRIREGFIKLE